MIAQTKQFAGRGAVNDRHGQEKPKAPVRPGSQRLHVYNEGLCVYVHDEAHGDEIRALLGPPTEEVERPPGKQWRYQDGQCTLYVQLFPDIQTKQFGTLSYAVKSDNDTDEGTRLCLAQFQSRVQARRP